MKSKFLFVWVALLVIASCKREVDRKVKTKFFVHQTKVMDSTSNTYQTYILGNVTYTNEYDSIGRIISITGTDKTSTKYIYQDTSTRVITYDTVNEPINVQTKFLDALGRTDSIFTLVAKNPVSKAEKFIYSPEGKLVESRLYLFHAMTNDHVLYSLSKYIYKDGNAITGTYTIMLPDDTTLIKNPKTGKMENLPRIIKNRNQEVHYNYYLDKLNTNEATSNSKNLVKSSVRISLPKDTMEVRNYHYTFDDKGRIRTEVFETDDALMYDSTAYTY